VYLIRHRLPKRSENKIAMMPNVAQMPSSSTLRRLQNTIQGPVSYTGIGIHTGKVVSLRLCPAKERTGIVFQRVDLPGRPTIPATVQYVCDTARSTTLGVSDIRIHTVEHVLAAVRAYEIDNLVIEISSIEPPVGNGSSDVFVDMIEQAGIQQQADTVPIVKLQTPVFYSEEDVHIVAHPYDGYRISYTFHYECSNAIQCQFYSFLLSPKDFKQQIAPCRTFSHYEEVSSLMDRGLIKGGSLDNAVIIKDEAAISKWGLFFRDEMVRHKILDMIGDLSLVGYDFHAHIIAIRSGHRSNIEFSKLLNKTLTMENA